MIQDWKSLASNTWKFERIYFDWNNLPQNIVYHIWLIPYHTIPMTPYNSTSHYTFFTSYTTAHHPLPGPLGCLLRLAGTGLCVFANSLSSFNEGELCLELLFSNWPACSISFIDNSSGVEDLESLKSTLGGGTGRPLTGSGGSGAVSSSSRDLSSRVL